MDRYSFTQEPRGQDYADLLEFCGQRAATAILVVRELDWLDEEALDLLSCLRPYQAAVQESAEWPGTRLLRDTATVYRFHVHPELLATLKTAASGLYEWQQPKRPEDLCFLRQLGAPILASVAHEGDAYLDLDSDDARALSAAYPSLTRLLRRERNTDTT